MKAILESEAPILLVHGIEDELVPSRMSIAMYNERKKSGKGVTELLLVPGARHAKSYMTCPGLWESTVFSFIEKYADEKGETGRKSPSP
jgi:hypothetical protein